MTRPSVDPFLRWRQALCALLLLAGSSCHVPQEVTSKGIHRLFADADWTTVGRPVRRQLAVIERLPSRTSEVLTVPRGAVLSWRHAARHPGRRRAVEVSVSVRDDDGEHTVYSETVESARREPGRWASGRADLTAWAGQTVEVLLEARYARQRENNSPGGKPGQVYWGSPYLFATPGPSGRRPSVILILIDTLRADRLGSYGYHRNLTPHLDELAARGALFENAFSQSNWTLASMASIVSGLYPSAHGVVRTQDRLRDSATHLPRLLARNGYLTQAFHHGGYLNAHFGFDDGFDRYDRWSGFKDISKAARFVEQHREVPFFLLLHTYDVHAPYTSVPEEYWRRYVGSDCVDPRDLKHSRPSVAQRQLDRRSWAPRSDADHRHRRPW